MIVENIALKWEQPDNLIYRNGVIYNLPPHMLLKSHEPELREVLVAIGFGEYATKPFHEDENHGLAHVVLPRKLTNNLPAWFKQNRDLCLRILEEQRKDDGNLAIPFVKEDMLQYH